VVKSCEDGLGLQAWSNTQQIKSPPTKTIQPEETLKHNNKKEQHQQKN
jgi:hypothetical protein